MIRRACCALTRFWSIDARVGDGARHGRFRDLVELGPVEDRLRQGRLQDLLEVPADGLALAVRVGGEIDRVGAFRGPLQVRDRALLARQDLVGRRVAVLPVDRDSLLQEVADVAVARHDGEVLSEELSERAALAGDSTMTRDFAMSGASRCHVCQLFARDRTNRAPGRTVTRPSSSR